MGGRRLNRRDRRMSKELRDLLGFARRLGRGVVWSAMFVGFLASLAGVLIMAGAGYHLYAALFLPSSVLLGWALWRWGA